MKLRKSNLTLNEHNHLKEMNIKTLKELKNEIKLQQSKLPKPLKNGCSVCMDILSKTVERL